MGFGEVLRVFFVNWESVTNGAIGLTGIPNIGREIMKFFRSIGFNPSSIGLKNNQFTFLFVLILLLLITAFIIWFLVRQNHSRVGRAFAAIKMDEKAAEAMGINITYYKVLSFTQSAILAGFAGALLAHVMSYISPADFGYHRAVDILIYAVFGGSDVILGTIFGAIFMTILPEALRFISEYRYMIYGLILIFMMAFRPQGIITENMVKGWVGNFQRRGGAVMVLNINHITKNFGGISALTDVSIHVKEGEIHGLIGPNGAGKTTIFNIITNIFPPTTGEVTFLNEKITGIKPHKITDKGICRTFQNIRLFHQMTTIENVMVGAHSRLKSGVLKRCISS